MSRRIVLLVVPALAVLALAVAPAATGKAGKGFLFYNGGTVRTVVPPAAFPKEGRDPFYKVMDGAEGQLGIAGVAPGAKGYHGGHWKVYHVTFNVEPYLLTSAAAVMAAESAGDVTVTRAADEDFLCPVQP